MVSRDPRRTAEDQLQRAIVDLLAIARHRDLIFFHIANEGERSPATAMWLKQMGFLPGVADLCLVLPGGRAAFLEVKTQDGRQSLEQKAFQAQCEAVGVPYAVVRSLDEAEAVLASWGALRPKRRAA